jgi:hypothetical protein
MAKPIVTILAALIAAAVCTQSAEASPADGCARAVNQPNASTAPGSKTLFRRVIELRHSTSTHCAWGRIRQASPGDKVWVNQKRFPSGTRKDLSGEDGFRGQAFVGAGATQAFTPDAFDDKDPVKMQACGKAANRVEIVCTEWF